MGPDIAIEGEEFLAKRITTGVLPHQFGGSFLEKAAHEIFNGLHTAAFNNFQSVSPMTC